MTVDGGPRQNRTESASGFSIFHYRDGTEPTEAGAMSVEPGDQANFPLIERCVEAGALDGAESRIVFSGHGMSLVHVWFKPNFPLPRHSHDSDCLYYITAGSLRLGTRELTVGDGFFLPAGVPYTYTAGPAGVELMEFRNRESFDYRDLNAPAFWVRALAAAQANHEVWKTAPRPSGTTLD